ncbi:MAG TPA: hypothetical protein VML75_24930 [Kofleriaceae bacterium]|nr:hypothetical protein [Kofleriaceae bacterium]
MLPLRPRSLAVGLAVSAILLASAPAADAKRKSKETYYFEVSSVTLAEGVPPEIARAVRAQLAVAIEKHDKIVAEIVGAPDPATDPKKYKAYLKKKKLRAFKVNVEVTAYEHKIVKMPAPRTGQRLEVSIQLHTFGETIPDRVMAFSGGGSAGVMIEIGKKLRPRETEVANHDTIEMALEKAIAESIIKLAAPPPKK